MGTGGRPAEQTLTGTFVHFIAFHHLLLAWCQWEQMTSSIVSVPGFVKPAEARPDLRRLEGLKVLGLG